MVGIIRMVVGRRNMVEKTKVDYKKSGDESKGDGEDMKGE
jgi:hypothetical protein